MADYDNRPFLQLPPGAPKFLGDGLFVWKDSLILSGEHLVGEIVEYVVSEPLLENYVLRRKLIGGTEANG